MIEWYDGSSIDTYRIPVRLGGERITTRLRLARLTVRDDWYVCYAWTLQEPITGTFPSLEAAAVALMVML